MVVGKMGSCNTRLPSVAERNTGGWESQEGLVGCSKAAQETARWRNVGHQVYNYIYILVKLTNS